MAKRFNSSESDSNQQRKPSSKAADGSDKYEIGYGKAPKHSRFKPGQSGNPNGRPKGVRNFKTDVKATLETRVRVKGEDSQRTFSTQEAALLRLREKALHGDARALDRLIALAQTYNNDDVAASINRTTDDARLLELYKSRLLSGAVERTSAEDTLLNKVSDAEPKNNVTGGGS